MKRQRVTVKTIAEITGFSPSTVARVVSGRGGVRKEKAEKILRVAKEIGYRRNFIAHSMKTGRSYTLGVLIPDISYPFYPLIVRGICDTVEKEGYMVIIGNSYNIPEKEARNIHSLLERQIEGLIIAPIQESVNEEYFHELHSKNIPLIVIDRKYTHIKTDFVGVDDRYGAYSAVEYLISLGHKKIGIISGPLNSYTGIERFKGYRDAIIKNNLKFKKEFVMEMSYQKGEEEGYKAMKELIKKTEITAVFCATDSFAIGAMRAIREEGLKIPDDISVIGFADLFGAEYTQPPLTTVYQPKYEIGVKAAELFLRRIKEKYEGKTSKKKEEIYLKTNLIIRNSTGKPKIDF